MLKVTQKNQPDRNECYICRGEMNMLISTVNLKLTQNIITMEDGRGSSVKL